MFQCSVTVAQFQIVCQAQLVEWLFGPLMQPRVAKEWSILVSARGDLQSLHSRLFGGRPKRILHSDFARFGSSAKWSCEDTQGRSMAYYSTKFTTLL